MLHNNYDAVLLDLFQLRGLSSLLRVNVTSPVGAKKKLKKTVKNDHYHITHYITLSLN